MPTSFEEKFKKLNIENKDKKIYNQENVNSSSVFKELMKNISENVSEDEVLILILLLTFKNKKTSNSLILALLYMLLWF